MTKRSLFSLLLTALLFTLPGCQLLTPAPVDSRLTASGTITAHTIQVAPEISGKILEINANKGGTVKQGDVLFRLDDQLLQAQLNQADAAVKVAQANLDIARQKLAGAQSQLDLANQAARIQDERSHTTAWKAAPADKINLPIWYFQKDEEITALKSQISLAQKNLQSEQSNLGNELAKASNGDFVGAEKRLAEAQAAYTITKTVLDQAKAAKITADLVDAAQKSADAATSELDAAQKAYDQLLSSDSAKRVREARARVAVANERLTISQDELDALMTGGSSLSVTAAQLAVDQAKSAVTQAEAGLAQAQSASQFVKVQLSKTAVLSPLSGTVLSRPFNPGEVAIAGSTIIEIGQLDPLTLTVYVPENQYGRIRLGQKASITVDSFAGRTFSGSVTYISDQAEFTPRNVQTVESRSTTVYKIEITLPNSSGELKPGIPADAVFD